MAATANARGITVTIYVALIYLSPRTRCSCKAEQDRRDGIDSPERSMSSAGTSAMPEGATFP